jgi:hypothetical protein
VMSVPAARSLWVTRVQLPSELAQSVNQRDGGGTVVTGGRRNNPRGKRVLPLCPSATHHDALQSLLARAANDSAGRLERLEVSARYGVATFDSAETAESVSERLEATEVQWTAKQRHANCGGPGTTALDAQASCLIDFVPDFLSGDAADALFRELLCDTPWSGAKGELVPEDRQPRQVPMAHRSLSAPVIFTHKTDDASRGAGLLHGR